MRKRSQRRAIHACECLICQRQPHSPTAHEHRAINRLLAATDERSRRLFVGFLARQHGYGGIALFAQITGLDRNTIARGQRELQRGTVPWPGRVRRPGAGCKRVEKKVPGSWRPSSNSCKTPPLGTRSLG